MSHLTSCVVVALTLAVATTSAVAQDPQPAQPAETPPEQWVEARAAELQWSPIEVPGFPAGLQIAALSGNSAESGPYSLRLKFPDGYAFPVHWHPMTEHLTVLSGRFFLGMGEKDNPSALQAYTPGDFLVAPARMSHFGRVEGETVVQLHGMGPFEIKLGAPDATMQ